MLWHSFHATRRGQTRGGTSEEARTNELVGRSLSDGKFMLEAVIGTGGCGDVYRAHHRDLRIPIAVKVLHHDLRRDIDFARRFHAEALAASRLDHPNLMRVLDFGQEPDGLLYLAMEHLDGRSLATVIEDEDAAPLPLAHILDLVMQICAGLAHAHERGIVHRDVKPGNVVLVANTDDDDRPDELVKVCDFGIAIEPTDGVESRRAVGTPDYMSPEQCRREPLDGRSDLYACGVVLYELVTGQMPFGADTVVGLLDQHLHNVPTPPSALPRGCDRRLERIIMQALSKEPGDRQASTRALRSELGALLVAMTERAPTPVPAVEPAEPTSEPTSEPRSDRPSWLEPSGRGYRHDSSGELPAVDPTGRVLATELDKRPGPWLTAFASAGRAATFEREATRLAAALPILLAEKRVATLFAIHCTLDELAHRGPEPAWCGAPVRALQLAFADPTFLASLAEAALSADRPLREVTELVLRLGTPVTFALYSARLRLSEQTGVRRRFVLLVRELSLDALPMLRAGLARLATHRDRPVAVDLAIDLLRASPRVLDVEDGALAAVYVTDSPPALASAAADALVGFWGARAKPLLLGLLDSADASVIVTAIDGLRGLQLIDELAIAQIARAARAAPCAAVRAAARAAFMDTSGSVSVLADRAACALRLTP